MTFLGLRDLSLSFSWIRSWCLTNIILGRTASKIFPFAVPFPKNAILIIVCIRVITKPVCIVRNRAIHPNPFSLFISIIQSNPAGPVIEKSVFVIWSDDGQVSSNRLASILGVIPIFMGTCRWFGSPVARATWKVGVLDVYLYSSFIQFYSL